MHTFPSAAAPPASDRDARDTDVAAAVTVRVCVHAAAGVDADALRALHGRLPAGARIAVFGECPALAEAADATRHPAAGHDAIDVAIAAAGLFPGEHLIVLRAGVELPAFACERLLRALGAEHVLGAVALDRRRLRIDDQHAAETIDACCFAWSDRRLYDDEDFPTVAPATAAWHGARLAALGAERLRDRDALDAGGLRVAVLDHLFVDGVPPCTASRDADVPSELDPLRDRVVAALAAGAAPAHPGLDAKPVLLHVLHGWGGGAERFVRDYAAADRHAHHLVLIARGSFSRRRHGEWLELCDGSLQGPPLRRWPLPQPIADTALGNPAYRALLDRIVREFCVDAVVVSSLIGHSLDALRTGLPLTWIVHDHYPLWPVLHRDFGDASLAFDAAQRAGDLAAGAADGEFSNRDAHHWTRLREATAAALIAAEATLVAPSRSALQNQLRLAPELARLRSHVIAHGLAAWSTPLPQAWLPPPRQRLRLVIPGRIRRGKGADLLAAVLPRLRGIAEIVLLGAGSDAHALFGRSGVHIVLDYRRDDLPTLLAQLRPDAALLLPTVAETFSYTLSELRSLGVPVVATRVGALRERIDDGVDGFLVDPTADAVVARVVQLAALPAALIAVRDRVSQRTAADTTSMAESHASALQLGSRTCVRYAPDFGNGDTLRVAELVHTIDAARAAERRARDAFDESQAESERRASWGHGLNRELAGLHTELAGLHTEFGERTRWALALDAELQDVKPRYEQILQSSSWRITAPLRALNAHLRGVRASVAFRSLHLRNTLGRVRGSLAQRGLSGTLARIAQELRKPARGAAAMSFAAPQDDDMPFALPAGAAPRVSIVIPVYNKIAYTTACLRSIVAHAGAIPFEVIVVDDGSSDATPQRLASIEHLRVLRNAENLGFIGSCNAGAALAGGEYVLFLNNDTVVTAGWLDALVACIEEAPQAGLVGAKLVYPDGRLQEAGGIVFADASGWNVGRFESPDDARYNFRREVDYCSGAAILLRRDLFATLGAFDARYTPAYYEDTDLAFAVRARGLKVWYEPTATVVHFEGVTSGTDVNAGIKRFQVINREKFLAKWKDALVRQPAPGTPITVAATHRAKKRVLIVDATTPTPDQDSGSLRMVNLMRVLADLGCQTSFLPDNRAWVPRYTAALQALGVEALYSPYAASPIALLRDRGREFDLIILSRHYVAASYVGLVRLYAPQARLAFDTVDLHYLREERAVALSANAELARHAAATRAQELKLVRESDVTLVVSPVERALLAKDAPGARVDVLSNVHEVYGCRRGFAERRDLVFVGGFQHPPNTDAVVWFVHEVFALIRAESPDIRFHVIGSKVPESVRALADEHVLVHGYIEDIAPYMDGCRLSVAPLRYGAGVKGKVNMAMSFGLPVVATTMAIEGMHVRIGEDVLVADEAAAFAAAVVRAYGDESLWLRLSSNGLANVERHFSFDAARSAVRKLLQ